jgi:AraC-like DNA-binding protein
MPGSVVSVFGEAADFEKALHAVGCLGVLVTGRGGFCGRLIEISLQHMRLWDAEEELARIGFFAVPLGTILVILAEAGAQSSVWGGIVPEPYELLTIAPGERLHVRSHGRCRWCAIQVSEAVLVDYGRIMIGPRFAVPRGISRWRPALTARRDLLDLCRAAIRATDIRSRALADVQAAHGLQQQLIGELIKSLSAAPATNESPSAKRRRNVVARFEEILLTGSSQTLPEIRGMIGVSEKPLRDSCKAHLGMSPSAYRRLHVMQRVHRMLRANDPKSTTIGWIAARSGFRDPDRFARNYRIIYGELPSATLRRGHHETPRLRFRRRR